MSDSESFLADRLAGEDDSAFVCLFHRYYQLVFGICFRALGHRQDAEDATQETFSRISRYLHRWDRKRPIEPWIVSIASNRSRTFLSKQRSRLKVSALQESSVHDSSDPHAASEILEEVRFAVEDLPAMQKTAFTLFHTHGRSYQEIAAEMDVPEGTAKTWVRRARVRLMERLRHRIDPGSVHDSGRSC